MKPTLPIVLGILCLVSFHSLFSQTCSGKTFPGITAPSSCTYSYTGTGLTGWVNASGITTLKPTDLRSDESLCILADYTGNLNFNIKGNMYIAPNVSFTGAVSGFSNGSRFLVEGFATITNQPNINSANLIFGADAIVSFNNPYTPGGSTILHNAGEFNVLGDINLGGSASVVNYPDAKIYATGDSFVNAPFDNCGLFELEGSIHSGGSSSLNNLCSLYIHTDMKLNADYTNEGLIILDGNIIFGTAIFYNNGTFVVNSISLNNDEIHGNDDTSLLIVRANASLTSGGAITGHLYYDMDDQGGFDTVCASCIEDIDIVTAISIPSSNEDILANCGQDVVVDPIIEKSLLDFDGVDDYLSTPSFIHGLANITIMAWVKSDSGNTTDMALAGEDYSALLYLQNGSIPTFRTTGASYGTTSLSSLTAINQDEWHHVAGVYNSVTGKMEIFIDGQLVNSTSVGVSGSALANTASTNGNFEMGRLSRNVTNKWYFKGDMDEVRVIDTALTEDQIQRMVYQEIKNEGGLIRGTVIDKDIVDIKTNTTISWNNLLAYYPMTNIISFTRTKDYSSLNRITKLHNITSFLEQTAPLPYESSTDGDWSSTATWLHGDVWDIEDEVNNQDWSIVKINTNVTTSASHSTLGLFVEPSKTLTVNGDSKIENTWYLKLDGEIDLQGESQLVQGIYSELDVASAGGIERDQQGTADTYTYNYWSSPVGAPNTSSNNNSYKLQNIFSNGSNPASPNAITFLPSNQHDGQANGNNISLSNRWIWKYADAPAGNYSEWQHVQSMGDLKAGEGFTMKGPGSGGITDDHNYVFNGKPNNGDINLNITAGYGYLVGNPYPSAIDAKQFILDNVADLASEGVSDGTLYFWEHWGGGSHVLSEYQGGYGMYNLSGSVPTASQGSSHPDVSTGGTPTKTPGRYIPVGQGFFVTGFQNGTINFNNGQRVFQKEANNSESTFMRSASTSTSNEEDTKEERMQIRLGFNSVGTYRRQLLVTADENATMGKDLAFDAPLWDYIPDDMYWVIDQRWYGIQGIDSINGSTVLPLGMHAATDGINTITIDELVNIPDNLEIYVHDKELEIYHNLRESDYSFELVGGTFYSERMEITFVELEVAEVVEEQEPVEDLDEPLSGPLQLFYANNKNSIIIDNPMMDNVVSLELYNVMGQPVFSSNTVGSAQYSEVRVNPASGVYIVRVQTEVGNVISKKVLVK